MELDREWIDRGANGRREKPKVKGRGKGVDRSGKGKKGDKARNSDSIKQLKLFHFFKMINLEHHHIIRHIQFKDLRVNVC